LTTVNFNHDLYIKSLQTNLKMIKLIIIKGRIAMIYLKPHLGYLSKTFFVLNFLFYISIVASQTVEEVFNGELTEEWLELSWAGGNYSQFANISNNSINVSVPAGHSWGKTGIRSANTLFNIPEHTENRAVKLSFDIDIKNSSDFVFAIIPSNWDGLKEWRSHLVRLQVNYNEDGKTADISLVIQKSEKMRTTVNIQDINRIYMTVRSDKVVLVSDKNDTVVLQALMGPYAKVFNDGYKISALTHARESGLPAKLALKKIGIQYVSFDMELDHSLLTNTLEIKTLFDGHILGKTWGSFVKSKTEFDDSAKLINGALMVEVPADSAHANVGIQSNEPIIWLDYFGQESKREITLDFIPESTTGFAIAIANRNQYFIVRWFKNTESDSSTIQVNLSDSLYSKNKPTWEQQLNTKSPKQIKLSITPEGITLKGDYLPKHTQIWDRLFPNAGYSLSVFSYPEHPNKPVKMALKQISLNNLSLTPISPVEKKVGVKPLPIKEYFNGNNHENWEYNPWNLAKDSTVKCDFNSSGFGVLDLDNKSPSSTCGINYKDIAIKLDERIDQANYKMTIEFDSNKTKNFGIVWSHQKDRHNWDYCELSLLQTNVTENILNLRCPGVIQRTVDTKWLENEWDGKVNLVFNKNYIQVGLNNGTTILYNSNPPKNQYLYIMAPHYRYRETTEQMQLTKITGQWQPLEPINSVERWLLLEKKSFDPEKFIHDLANDLPFPSGKIFIGEQDDN